MNRLGLNITNQRFLINNIRSVVNKSNIIHECKRYNHVFTFKNQMPKYYCRNFKINNVTFKRLASTALYDSNEFMSQPLNDGGKLSEFAAEVLPSIVEPSFEELGLGGESIWGLLQYFLEYLHVDVGLPWWGAVAAATFTLRILVFPLVVTARKNALKLHENSAQLEYLQNKVNVANLQGDVYLSRLYQQDVKEFLKEKNIKMFRNFVPPIIQGGIFYSFFKALSGMLHANIESLHTGGIFWFKDLAMPDPYFILPIYTGASLWLILNYGLEAVKIQSFSNPLVKAVIYMVPCSVIVISSNMDSLILCYWVSNSLFSFLQLWIMKSERCGKILGTRDVLHTKDNPPI